MSPSGGARAAISRKPDARSRHRRTIAKPHFRTVDSVNTHPPRKEQAMTHDPITQLRVADARHRSRVHDAVLRHLAAEAPDRHWRRRHTRLP